MTALTKARPVQRSKAGEKYDKFKSNLLEVMREKPEARRDACNEIYNAKGVSRATLEKQDIHLDEKTLSVSDVQTSTVLSNMSVQYANDDYIGLRLMPVFDQHKRTYEYYEYDKRNRLAYPDDSMGTRSDANEINESRSKKTGSLNGRALKEFVDVTTINNQDAVLNEMMDAQEAVLDGLSFKQEKRIAAIMTSAASFGTNTTPVGAADRWNNGGDPIPVIDAALAAMWSGRGSSQKIAYCSLDVWNALKVNPFLLDLIRVDNGMLTPAMFTGLFGLDGLLVGEARQDTANEGQTASYSRIWTDVFGIVRVAQTPSKRNAVFGYTMREKPITQRMWFDDSKGEEGGWFTQSSHADEQKIVAADTGYLITTPI